MSLNKQRVVYIQQHATDGEQATLDAAMLKAIKEKGAGKSLVWQ